MTTSRWARVAVMSGITIVLAVGSATTVRAYQHKQEEIRDARGVLQRSLDHESDLRTDLAKARADTVTARAKTVEHRHGTENENESFRRVVSLAAAAAKDVEHAREALKLSTAERIALGASAEQARACVHAEQRAMRDIQSSDRGAAAANLNAGAAACSGALAGATGARFPYDFPDPFVLSVGTRYYAFSTNAGAGDVQVITSTDLVDWTLVGNALAGLPSWAKANATWAPAVLRIPATPTRPEAYVMYYTLTERASGAQCISSAVSAQPGGPYFDRTSGPLICERWDGGSIDPSPFVDADGSMWLLWKRERAAQPTTLRTQRLDANGRTLSGPVFDLLQSDRAWQHGVIEAPSMIHTADGYFLFFAGGLWNDASYATGVTRCDTPIGPCRAVTHPVMSGTDTVIGPGGAEVFTDRRGRLWIAYAAYVDPFVGWPYSRTLRFARVTIGGAGVTITPE